MVLDEAASEEEVDAVQAVLRDAGIAMEVTAQWRKPPQTGNGAFWMVLITVGMPVGAFLKQFLETIAEKAAESWWEALQAWLQDLRSARRLSTIATEGWVEIDGSDGCGLMIHDVPSEAYEELARLDWSQVGPGIIMWDDEAREWRFPPRGES